MGDTQGTDDQSSSVRSAPMSPSPLFCPYLDCDHKGRIDTEAITVHAYKSREERTPTRYHCAACDRTFSARRCTPF